MSLPSVVDAESETADLLALWRAPIPTAEGREAAFAAACARLESKKEMVKYIAAQSFSKLAKVGDERAVAALARRLTDENDLVRFAAVEAYGKVLKRGDSRVLSTLSPLLEDENELVREAAVEALGELAKLKDEEAISLLQPCLSDPCEDVREAAEEALDKVNGVTGLDNKSERPQDADTRKDADEPLDPADGEEGEHWMKPVASLRRTKSQKRARKTMIAVSSASKLSGTRLMTPLSSPASNRKGTPTSPALSVTTPCGASSACVTPSRSLPSLKCPGKMPHSHMLSFLSGDWRPKDDAGAIGGDLWNWPRTPPARRAVSPLRTRSFGPSSPMGSPSSSYLGQTW
eukprot:TRINITY_DN113383_c0_g1_i1.p1 TRINITY_DN113383_c0_g1~~TRINITY_DN113383_c0_g1_i1.p1  ORF type:complete len:354 (-),score=62.01 TRINITY_DN113383_c0_g1_i1:8-1045(-)